LIELTDRLYIIIMIGKTDQGGISVILPKQTVSLNIHKPILQDLFPIRLGYQENAINQSMNREKGIPEFTLHYVVKGKGYFEFNNQSILQKEGDLIIIPPNFSYFHFSDPDEPWSRYWVHFIGRQGGNFVKLLGIDKKNPSINIPSDSNLMNTWEEIYTWYNSGFSYTNLVGASTACSKFLGRILHLKFKSENRPKSSSDKIQNSIDFMKENLHRSYRLEQLANNAGLSATLYRNLFKEITSMSPIDFFIHLKIMHARQLLEMSHYTIQEVAELIGYEDPFYFSRIFKKIEGVSPKEYRKSKS